MVNDWLDGFPYESDENIDWLDGIPWQQFYEEEAETHTTYLTMIGNPLTFTWKSGQFNSDSGMKATSTSPTEWTWSVISSSTTCFYPSGSPTSWTWVSGSVS